jgi:hypothetical protein
VTDQGAAYVRICLAGALAVDRSGSTERAIRNGTKNIKQLRIAIKDFQEPDSIFLGYCPAASAFSSAYLQLFPLFFTFFFRYFSTDCIHVGTPEQQ